MRRKPTGEMLRQREAVRSRISRLLDHRWNGNQRQMAHDLGVTQGLISKIVNGVQGAGRDFLDRLSRQPGVDDDWLRIGTGDPLIFPLGESLPVARGVLPGPPIECGHLLTGTFHPIAKAFNRPSRYWLQLQPDAELLGWSDLHLNSGDHLLLDTDQLLTQKVDLVNKKLCGVRVGVGPAETYVLGFVIETTQGIEVLLPPIRKVPPASHAQTPKSPTRFKSQRTIRPLGREAERATKGLKRSNAEPDQTTKYGSRDDQRILITLDHIRAMCVSMERPSPIALPLE